MAGKKLLDMALDAARASHASRHIADPAQRAANLSRFQEGTPASVASQSWYHGSAREIPEFSGKRHTFVTTNPKFANAFAEQGAIEHDWDDVHKMWVPRPGSEIAPNVTPLHVRAENPFDYENPKHIEALNGILEAKIADPASDPRIKGIMPWIPRGAWGPIESKPVQDAIRSLGHDAFFVNEGGNKNLAVYNPETQLKSAIGNVGTFDPSIPRITEAHGGMIREHHAGGERVGMDNDMIERALRLARGGYTDGGDIQSNSMPVYSDGQVNWGDSDSAADFARADAALRAMRSAPAAPEARDAPMPVPRPAPVRAPYSAPRDVPLPPVRPANLGQPVFQNSIPEGPGAYIPGDGFPARPPGQQGDPASLDPDMMARGFTSPMSPPQPAPVPSVSMGYSDVSPFLGASELKAPSFGAMENITPGAPEWPRAPSRPAEGKFTNRVMPLMPTPPAPPSTDELLSLLPTPPKAVASAAIDQVAPAAFTTEQLLSQLPGAAPTAPAAPARAMPNMTPQQRDLIIRTIAAEASGKSPEEAQAIGHVILNRIASGRYGKTPEKVLFAPKQFEPWGDPRGSNYPMRHKPGTAKYEKAKAALDAALAKDDITGGATLFWGPKAQAALGRPAPKWGRTGGLDIGETRFHREEGGMVEEREGHGGGSRVISKALKALGSVAPEDRMMMVHNLKSSRLADVEKLGGLPVPSTAIIKPEHGFSNFGDITMVAPKEMAVPSRTNPIFGADVYSPRFPSTDDSGERIFKGFTPSGNRRYSPLTLENAVKEMKGNVRGGEGFSYGVGNIRAGVAPQFKSLEEIQAARGNIIPAEQFYGMKDEPNAQFGALAEKMYPHYGYGGDRWTHEQDLADMLRTAGMGNWGEINRSYKQTLPPELRDEARGFLDYLRQMPTEYFEGKPQRAVKLDEFRGAIVPDDIAGQVADPLRRMGVQRIETYDPGQASTRIDAMKKFGEEQFAYGGIVRRERHADGEAVGPGLMDPSVWGYGLPLFAGMSAPESALEQAAHKTPGERVMSMLNAEDLPKGQTYASQGPTGVERALQVIPNPANYLKRQGEAVRENLDMMGQGWNDLVKGNYAAGALGLGGGLAGYALSPITGAERVLFRDPYLNATGNLRDAEAVEMVADTALTGGLRGPANMLLGRGGISTAFQTDRPSRLAGSGRYALGAGAGAAGMTLAPSEAEAAKLPGGEAAARAIQAAKGVIAPQRQLSPLGLYSHGAETAAGLQQFKGTPDQMIASLRRASVKPDEFFYSGIADEAATMAKRAMIEKQYAPQIAQAEQAVKALRPEYTDVNQILNDPAFKEAAKNKQTPEGQAKLLYDRALNSMRSDMDSAMVLNKDWASRPSVTRDELAEHFSQSTPQIEERVLGYDPAKVRAARETAESQGHVWDELGLANQNRYIRQADNRGITEYGGDPKFRQYTLPGGENYREVLLKLPEQEAPYFKDFESYFKSQFNPTNPLAERIYREGAMKSWEASGGKIPDYKSAQNYLSSHYDDPNILAHIRMSDRTGPNGEKILHVEEVQSDWGQAGRKEGFSSPEDYARWLEADNATRTAYQKATVEHRRLTDSLAPPINEPFVAGRESPMAYQRRIEAMEEQRQDALRANPEFAASAERLRQASDARRAVGPPPSTEGVPKGPYVANTQGWTDLAVKRILKEAAEGGYDKIVWTPGAEQAKRYNLNKVIDRISYDPVTQELQYVKSGNQHWSEHPTSVEPKELSGLIGKEAAETLLSEPLIKGKHDLELENLEIGGRGMKSYYDQMLPKRFQELARKHDKAAQVGMTDVMLPPASGRGHNNPPIETLGITMTPQMRESILRGQHAYADGGSVVDRALMLLSKQGR